ncbi:MAG: NAD-dependent epimerase/dehydratase family protein [Opitutales bacterium]|nr:NAD-dependent epimerase/dehydratase family protein [Opitutales bacterium]MCH8540667.1 NAD-dependent epimerase/dehydratase family protein [Opitutales bacterium]
MGRLFITGANGFVGRLVVEHLAKTQDRTLITASRTSFSESSGIESYPAPDLNETSQWENFPDDVETIIHLASRAHVMGEKADQALPAYRKVNVEGTRGLLEMAGQKKIKRLIYLSSIKAVGESSEPGHPLSENSPLRPEDPYGISKQEAEALIQSEAPKQGLSWTIIRPPMMYGPGMKGNLPALANLVKKPWPLPFGGIRNNRRSLLATENLLDFLALCLRESQTTENQIFHLADPAPLSTRELIEHLAKAQNLSPKLLPVPPFILKTMLSLLGKKDVADRLLGSLEISWQKAREELDWEPPHQTSSALHRTFASSA